MSILAEPPTGFSHHHRGLADGGKVGSLRSDASNYENDLLQGIAFDRNVFDFNEKVMSPEQIGPNGLFQIETLVGAVAFAAKDPSATYLSHIQANITGTDGAIALVTVPKYLSEQNPWIEVSLDVEAATNLGLAIGFVDAIPAAAALVHVDIDTPELHADIGEAAVILIDTAEALTTLALVSEIGGTPTAVTGSPTASPYGIPPAVGTMVAYRVELRDNLAYAFVNGTLVATGAAASGPATGTLLAAIIQIEAKGATDKEVRLDYIDIGQERVDMPF